MRIGSVAERHKTLIRVNVPVVVARTVAFARDPSFKGKSMEELKSLRVGHVAGAKFASEASEGFAEVWAADKPEQLFEMLERDRIDLVIVGEETGNRIIGKGGLADVFPLGSSLKEVKFYHLLHERHADLVPKIEAVLKRMMQTSEPQQTRGKTGHQLKPEGKTSSRAPEALHPDPS